MDVIVMICLSFLIAGKYRNAQKQGAAKYILGMAAAVLATELLGLSVSYATQSLWGLGGAMITALIIIVFLYLSANKALLVGDTGQQPEYIVSRPAVFSAGAVITSCGLITAAVSGCMLHLVLSPVVSLSETCLADLFATLRIPMPGQLFSAVMGAAMAAICAGLLVLGNGIKGNPAFGFTVTLAAGVAGLYSVYFCCVSICYRPLLVTGQIGGILFRRIAVQYIPCLFSILLIIALCLFLLQLRPYMNTVSRGFSIPAIAASALAGIYLIGVFSFTAARSSVAFVTLYTWFTALSPGFLLMAVSVIRTASASTKYVSSSAGSVL